MCFAHHSDWVINFGSPDDWEYFLHYMGCLFDNESSMCMGTGGNPMGSTKSVECKNLKLPDEVVSVYLLSYVNYNSQFSITF